MGPRRRGALLLRACAGRAAVKKEFDGIKALFGEYQTALKKVYTVPVVPDPK